MKAKSIAVHLKPYRMLAKRRTTINHMFAAAIAPHDVYDEAQVEAALQLLGHRPGSDLECSYCGAPAETWDHVHATVKEGRFSGHGHRLGNLLPCCKPCNSRKGNKPWQLYLASLKLPDEEYTERRDRIISYLAAYSQPEQEIMWTDDHHKLDAIKAQLLALIADADEIAARIRSRRHVP